MLALLSPADTQDRDVFELPHLRDHGWAFLSWLLVSNQASLHANHLVLSSLYFFLSLSLFLSLWWFHSLKWPSKVLRMCWLATLSTRALFRAFWGKYTSDMLCSGWSCMPGSWNQVPRNPGVTQESLNRSVCDTGSLQTESVWQKAMHLSDQRLHPAKVLLVQLLLFQCLWGTYI